MRHLKVPRKFWDPISINPCPALARLRTLVIERNEKRMPKWKFRLAPDLVVRIQPQVSQRFPDGLYECLGVECDGASAAELMATNDALRGRDYGYMGFRIHVEKSQWLLRPTCIRGPRVTTEREWRPGTQWHQVWKVFDPAKGEQIRDRLAAAFKDGQLDISPASVLSPNCMICGKGLTDPASISRLIGPECYGSGSLDIPWLWEGTRQPQEGLHP